MDYTENYSLKKPAYDDNADIGDINDNFDSLDNLLSQQYKTVDITLAASAWVSKVATISNSEIPAHPGHVDIYLAETATATEQTAWRNSAAEYVIGSQQEGSLQIKAQLTAPAIALPLHLVITKI